MCFYLPLLALWKPYHISLSPSIEFFNPVLCAVQGSGPGELFQDREGFAHLQQKSKIGMFALAWKEFPCFELSSGLWSLNFFVIDFRPKHSGSPTHCHFVTYMRTKLNLGSTESTAPDGFSQLVAFCSWGKGSQAHKSLWKVESHVSKQCWIKSKFLEENVTPHFWRKHCQLLLCRYVFKTRADVTYFGIRRFFDTKFRRS